MPAGAKMSIASMKADPMIPKMSVTPFATRVSTNASDGVIFCTPVTALRIVNGGFLVMTGLLGKLGGRNPERSVPLSIFRAR